MVLGAVIGLLGSLMPEAIKLFKDWRDKKHEIEMFKLQMEYQKQMTELRIQEARAINQQEIDLLGDKKNYKH